MQGDLDVIRHDQKFDPRSEKPLLLSVEPLEGGGTDYLPFSHEFSDVGSLVGYETSFAINRSATPKQFALYLCKDSAKAGKCRAKATKQIDSLTNSSAALISPNRRKMKAAQDKIYFFQYFVASDAGIEFLSGNNQDEKRFEKMEEYLNSKFGPNADTKLVFEHVKQASQRIDSLPVTFEDNVLLINLPHYDKSKCGKTGR